MADEQPLFREGLCSAIRSRAGLDLVASANDGEDAVELIARHAPEVALLDACMDLEARVVVRRLHDESCPTRVVFLSSSLDSESIYSALQAGAAGYLSKREDESAICSALARAAGGDVVLSPDAQTALGHALERTPRPNGGLTVREQEVLELAADGLSTSQIADRMFLSRATIKTHLAHLYDKLGVSDKTAAVATALRRRLID